MKFIFIFTILFFCMACDGKEKKSTESKNISTLERPVEEEIAIEEESPANSTEIVIAGPGPETEPQVQPELELEEQPEPEPELETQIEVTTEIVPESPKPIIEETLYDFEILKNKGIHIVGRSILHEIRNPSAIYCSNTTFLNHEKIDELRVLFNALKGDEISVMDGTKIPILHLKSLIEIAIILLESNPHSRLCPQIYLAIDAI